MLGLSDLAVKVCQSTARFSHNDTDIKNLLYTMRFAPVASNGHPRDKRNRVKRLREIVKMLVLLSRLRMHK